MVFQFYIEVPLINMYYCIF